MGRCTQIFDTYTDNFADPATQRYMDKIAFALGIYENTRDELRPYKSSEQTVEGEFQNINSRN